MSDLRLPEINKVMMAGRLTRDPELKYTSAGKPFCTFSMAVSRRYKSGDGYKEEVLFMDVQVWGDYAERTASYCKKGHAIIVDGRLRANEWEDRATGQKRSRIELLADRISPLEWHGQGNGTGASRPATNDYAKTAAGAREIDEQAPDEDDIPF